MSFTQEEIVEGIDAAKQEFVEKLQEYGCKRYIINLMLPNGDPDGIEDCAGSAPALRGSGRDCFTMLADLCNVWLDDQPEEAVAPMMEALAIMVRRTNNLYRSVDELARTKLYQLMKKKLKDMDDEGQ